MNFKLIPFLPNNDSGSSFIFFFSSMPCEKNASSLSSPLHLQGFRTTLRCPRSASSTLLCLYFLPSVIVNHRTNMHFSKYTLVWISQKLSVLPANHWQIIIIITSLSYSNYHHFITMHLSITTIKILSLPFLAEIVFLHIKYDILII